MLKTCVSIKMILFFFTNWIQSKKSLKELEKNIIWLDKKYKICTGTYVPMLLANTRIMYIPARDFP